MILIVLFGQSTTLPEVCLFMGSRSQIFRNDFLILALDFACLFRHIFNSQARRFNRLQ